MPGLEEIEMDKRRKALDKDIAALLDKYLRGMEWDIPETDERRARQVILDAIRDAVDRLADRA